MPSYIKEYDMFCNGEYIPNSNQRTIDFYKFLANDSNIDEGSTKKLLRIMDRDRIKNLTEFIIVIIMVFGLGALLGWLVTDAFYQIKMALP